jgi:pimeloyl-ACP methyl ester carboxylesterase
MKSKIILAFVLINSFLGFSQNKTFDLLESKTETKILYDRVFGIANATKPELNVTSTKYYFQLYHEIQKADFLNRLPKLETIKTEAKLGFTKNQIPLSILIADFEKINPQAFLNGDLYSNSNNQIECKNNASSLFEKHTITMMASVVTKSKSNKVNFIMNDKMLFNTTSRVIKTIELKANDNKVWREFLPNIPFEVQFKTTGKQIINYKIEFNTGEIVEQSFQIEIENIENTMANKSAQDNMQEPNIINTINATIPFQGYDETASFIGQGEYELFLDTTNGVFDKPIVLIDGFDPGDGRNIASIYQLLNYNTGDNLADYLRSEGFDIVILNFPTYTRTGTTTIVDGGADYIQRNAFILVALINQINAQKIGSEKNVVIGPSMGGLIARYALRYMEMNSLNHDTRLYISFDAPHLGANVPISFQHQINYLAYGPLGFTELQDYVDGYLKSPSSRQMLIDQFEGHLQTGNQTEFNTSVVLPTGKPGFRDVFQNELNTMGFPNTTRNIAISNGANNGTTIGTPAQIVMAHTFNTSSTERAIIDLKFTPTANQTLQVSRFRGQYSLFGNWITIYESQANSKAPTFTDGLDTAPGGRYDMYSLESAFGTSALLTEFFDNLLAQYFCFIPTLSSMAISNTNNLYTPVSIASNTPFAAYSIPTVNENHVTLTNANAAFAINEIMNPVLTVPNNELESLWVVNPIQNQIVINSPQILENATITIINVLGEIIYEAKNKTVENSTTIENNLQKGVYLLKIENENGSMVKKLIKN